MTNWRKGKGREVEDEEKEKRGKKVQQQQSEMAEKCKELIISPSLMGMEKGQKKKECKKGDGRPQARQVLGKFGTWLVLFMVVGQNWLSASAAAEGPERRTEAVMRMQQAVQVKECRRAGEISQRWRQRKGEERSESFEVYLAQWLCLEYREKSTSEGVKESELSFLWDTAQTEEGGNGGAVQQ